MPQRPLPRDNRRIARWRCWRRATCSSQSGAYVISDVFETRLMLRKVICTMGEEAATMFYPADRFT
jgi:hypothetical protein